MTERVTIRMRTAQESGKSWQSDKFIASVAKSGKTVLLAVPNGELAMEHKKRLKQHGVEAFCLMSHRNLFKHIADFDCPSYEDIQMQQDLGVSTLLTKRQFCKGCPMFDDCPYPRQYTVAKESEIKCIIIQHAHLSCKETVFQLLHARKFDLLVIDESPIDSIYKHVKVTEAEIALLKEAGFTWTDELVDWFEKGGYPGPTIVAWETDLQILRNAFADKNVPWRIHEFVRFYNDKTYYDQWIGLFDFHPLPDVPVRIITDATTPKEMLEIVFDCPIVEYGEDEVLDHLQFNPENRVIQVLDSSLSKTALEANDGELFYSWLEFIGDVGRKEHAEEKLLVTVYKSHKEAAKDWLGKNYPDVLERVTFNHLAVGTNAFESFPVQFLLCGVYFSGKQFLHQAYILKSIANYHNRRNNRPEIQNMYPFQAEESEKVAVPSQKAPIRRITETGEVREYPIEIHEPRSFYYKLVYRYLVGKTQQALRMRFNSGNKRTLYILGNMNLPSFMINKSVLKDQLIGYQFESED